MSPRKFNEWTNKNSFKKLIAKTWEEIQIRQRLILGNFEVGVPILDISILCAQIKKKSTYKAESQSSFKIYHFNPFMDNIVKWPNIL